MNHQKSHQTNPMAKWDPNLSLVAVLVPEFWECFFHSFPVPELEIQNPLIVQSSFHGWLTIWTSDPILFGLFKEAI